MKVWVLKSQYRNDFKHDFDTKIPYIFRTRAEARQAVEYCWGIPTKCILIEAKRFE